MHKLLKKPDAVPSKQAQPRVKQGGTHSRLDSHGPSLQRSFTVSPKESHNEDAARSAASAAFAGLRVDPLSAKQPKVEGSAGGEPAPPEVSSFLSREMAANRESALLKPPRMSHAPVYLHVGTETRAACTKLNAPAFSVGSHIFATHDIARSDTLRNRALTAHELAHVQQNIASTDSNQIQRADPVKFYSPAEAAQLAKLAQGKKTDYEKEARKLLVGVDIGAFGLGKVDFLNTTEALKKLLVTGNALNEAGDGWLSDNKHMIESGKKLLDFCKAYKKMLDQLIELSWDQLLKDKHLYGYLEDSHIIDAAQKYLGITFDFLLFIDQGFKTSKAFEQFIADPTENFTAALNWATECGALLQTAGAVVSNLPAPFGTLLSAPFKIPTKAIAAYSTIMIEYVAKIDAMSGGSSDGAKLVVDDEVLTGEVIPLARGASIRRMGAVSSIIWGEHKELIQKMKLEDAKWFIGQELSARITGLAAGDDVSYEMLGMNLGSTNDHIGWLIEQREYVVNFKA